MFKIVKANVPDLPDWLFKRPHLNHNNITKEYMPFLTESVQRQEQPKVKKLDAHPVDIQETFLIEDLLYAMTSIEGVYIKRKIPIKQVP